MPAGTARIGVYTCASSADKVIECHEGCPPGYDQQIEESGRCFCCRGEVLELDFERLVVEVGNRACHYAKGGTPCLQSAQRAWNDVRAQFGEAIGLVAAQPEVARALVERVAEGCEAHRATSQPFVCRPVARPKRKTYPWVWIGATAAGLWWLGRRA